jgi:hypothetical protein
VHGVSAATVAEAGSAKFEILCRGQKSLGFTGSEDGPFGFDIEYDPGVENEVWRRVLPPSSR